MRLCKFSKLEFKDKILKLFALLIKVQAPLVSSNSVLQKHVSVFYALSSDDMDSLENIKSFDSDSQTCVCDNSANTHIWNNIKNFIPASLVKLSASASSSVVTICGSNVYPTSIGDVKIAWADDEGIPYRIVLKDVLYFPNSPVNVLSITAFAAQLNDDDGTWIKTARH